MTRKVMTRKVIEMYLNDRATNQFWVPARRIYSTYHLDDLNPCDEFFYVTVEASVKEIR